MDRMQKTLIGVAVAAFCAGACIVGGAVAWWFSTRPAPVGAAPAAPKSNDVRSRIPPAVKTGDVRRPQDKPMKVSREVPPEIQARRERRRQVDERRKAFEAERERRMAERENSPEMKARRAMEERHEARREVRREAERMRSEYENAMDDEMRARYRRRPIEYWMHRVEARKRHGEEFRKRHGLDDKESSDNLPKEGQKQEQTKKE